MWCNNQELNSRTKLMLATNSRGDSFGGTPRYQPDMVAGDTLT